jgi:TonB family protein
VVRSRSVAPGAAVEPTIVHVTVDEQGNVQESEVLQSSGVSEQALALVKQTKLMPAPQTGGTPPRQREVFVHVEFAPAQSR